MADKTAQRDEFLKIANERLYPSLGNPNFLVLRSRRQIFKNWIDHFAQNKLRILDIGGRYQPYRPLLEEHISQYVAVDICKTDFVDVVSNGETLPFAPNTFDLAIATQVFEYISKPCVAANQIHALLKPSGKLIASMVSFAPRFGDDEYWRFTPQGIRATLSSFNRVEIIPETLSLGGLVRTMNLAAHSYAHFGPMRKAYEWTFCPLLNIAGLAVERLHLTKNDQFSPNYSILAEK